MVPKVGMYIASYLLHSVLDKRFPLLFLATDSGTILCGLVEPYCAFIARELYCALVVGEYMKGLVEKGNKCFNNLKRSKIKNIFLIAQQGI